MKGQALAPLGLGTPDTEALSSYVQRLAQWNQTLPSQLVHRLFAHLAAGDTRLLGYWKSYPGAIRSRGNINGFAHAGVWLRELAAVTGRSDLPRLTTASWEHAFPPRHLLAPTLRWCPFCLLADKIPFYRLLWLLAPVKVCIKHHCALIDRCPTCGGSVPVLHPRSSVLACPKCATRILHRDGRTPPIEPPATDLWVAQELGAVVARAFDVVYPMAGNRLRQICEHRGVTTPTQLAHLVGRRKVTAWVWWRNRVSPSLPHALLICRALGLHLVDVLSTREPSALVGTARQHPAEMLTPGRQPRRKHDWIKIRQHLKAESTAPLSDAKSLAAVARGLKVATRMLREHEPALCRRIGQKYLRKVHLRSKKKYALLKQEILKACRFAQRRGIPIRQARIAALLEKPGLFSRPQARQFLSTEFPPFPLPPLLRKQSVATQGK